MGKSISFLREGASPLYWGRFCDVENRRILDEQVSQSCEDALIMGVEIDD